MSTSANVSITYRDRADTPYSGMNYGGDFEVDKFRVESHSTDRVHITLEGREGRVKRLRFTMESKPLIALAHALISAAEGDIRSLEGNF